MGIMAVVIIYYTKQSPNLQLIEPNSAQVVVLAQMPLLLLVKVQIVHVALSSQDLQDRVDQLNFVKLVTHSQE